MRRTELPATLLLGARRLRGERGGGGGSGLCLRVKQSFPANWWLSTSSDLVSKERMKWQRRRACCWPHNECAKNSRIFSHRDRTPNRNTAACPGLGGKLSELPVSFQPDYPRAWQPGRLCRCVCRAELCTTSFVHHRQSCVNQGPADFSEALKKTDKTGKYNGREQRAEESGGKQKPNHHSPPHTGGGPPVSGRPVELVTSVTIKKASVGFPIDRDLRS